MGDRKGRPYGGNAPGALVRQSQARLWNRTRLNFPHGQGPVARKEPLAATQILRAGRILPDPRDNPRNGGPGVRRLGAPERCSSGAVPRRSFGFFPIAGKETRPAGRNPPAARRRRNPPARNETALSSSPHPSRLRRATFPYPLCRFATSPLDKGSRPPRGRLFWGGAPSSAPVCALGHLPPRGKAIVVGRRNEVSHKVLCQAFFQESGKTLSSRDWDESVWFASWCHPISERPGRSLWTPCCGGGAAPVSRPAGGAVFGRVRLRGVLSTWGRSPWDLSLSGGIPVTHAPSWR